MTDDGEETLPGSAVTPLQLPSSTVLEVLFERAPEIITIVDRDSRQQMVNAAGLRLLGFAETFRRPEDGWMFVHPDDRDRLAEHRRLIEEHHCQDGHEALPPVRYRVRAGTGEWRWLETLVADLRDVPEVAGRVAFSRDVTEAEERAQALLESQTRLAALVGSLRGGAFIADAEDRVLLANDRLSELFDVERADLRAMDSSTSELVAALSVALVDSRPLEVAAATEGSVHLDVSVVTCTGRELEIEVVPICDGTTHFGRLWMVHDATVRKEEERRSRALLELEQQARRSAELHAEQLAAYDRLRNDFVAGVSHELRTPLTAIASAAELMLSSDDVLDPALAGRLEIIRRNAERLRGMIEDLLLVGRLDAGMLSLDLRGVRLGPIVTDVLSAIEPAATARGVAVRHQVDDDLAVWADARRVSQVMSNLVDNAIKFTPPGTEVLVTADLRDAEVLVSVRDHGPGIPAPQRDAVLEAFVRTPEADRSATPGSGLGLAIVKGLVELHGGSVTITDAPDRGAIIGFTLPRAPDEETER